MKRIAILTALLFGASCAWAQGQSIHQTSTGANSPNNIGVVDRVNHTLDNADHSLSDLNVKLAEANVTIAQLKQQIVQLQFQLLQAQYPQVQDEGKKAQDALDAAKKFAEPKLPAHTGKSEPMPRVPEPALKDHK